MEDLMVVLQVVSSGCNQPVQCTILTHDVQITHATVTPTHCRSHCHPHTLSQSLSPPHTRIFPSRP